MRYLYRPEGDRTPVHDPVLGHLSYDGVYEDPRCADDPRFQPAPTEDEPATVAEPDAVAETADDASPEAEQAPQKRARATGRS